MSVYDSYTVYPALWNNSFPSHWKVLPLYALAKEKSICNCTDLELLSVYLDAGIIPFSKKAEKRTNVTSTDLSKYQRVDYGDFVLNNQQAWRGSVGVSFYTGIVSPAYIVLAMNDKLDSKFANYIFRSSIMVDQYLINSNSVGSIQRNIHWAELKRISVPVPPREEQDQIVRFLDWKVSEINRLINIKRKEIERLEELKKAVVSHAVIRGLDGNEYSHIPLKRAFHILDNCRMPIAADMRNQNSEVLYDYYGASGAIDKIDGYTIDDDVLLIGEDGANLRLRNLPLIYQVHGKAWINNHAHILKPMDFMDYYYSFYMLETLDISIFITGAAQPKLTQEALRNLQIIAPPIEEQRKISAYLDVKCGKINTIIENKQSQIKALQEFKTRLISDVVTGKIDVRGIEIPEYEYTAEESDIDEKPDLTDGELEYD